MKKFSYAKLLTLADIVEILKRNDLRLKTDVPQPLMRSKGEYGYKIVAKCEHIEGTEESKLYEFMSGALFRNLGAFGAISGMKKYSAYGGDELIEIGDYYMMEILSLKDDDSANEYLQKLTDSYHEFMVEKFGDEYTKNAKKFFDDLKKKNLDNNESLQK